MPKTGRPPKYHSLEEVRQAQRDSAKRYYDKNSELINQKARDKRRAEKEGKDEE